MIYPPFASYWSICLYDFCHLTGPHTQRYYPAKHGQQNRLIYESGI